MRNLRLLCATMVAAWVLWISAPVRAAEGQPSLRVMTFNLRFASPTPPNSWPQRRPVMKECIRQTQADVIGTQEGVYYQLRDMAGDLPEYEWIGLGREGGSRGEFMAVFFRKDRLEPLEYDHFWLSDTPMLMGSRTWGPKLPRMVTWVRFRDLATRGEFYFINTHFDHQVQEAREKSAVLVRQRVEELKTALPVILVGDFNAAAEKNKAYQTLVEGGFFADTWLTAKENRGPRIATFHNYKGAVPDGDRIDWILTRGPITAVSTEIVTFNRDGQYPSDHFPVLAELRIGTPEPARQ